MARVTITVRHPTFDWSDLPRHWIAGSRVATAYGNAGHVFIPLGEEFFIDSVRHFRDAVDGPGQRVAVNAFIGQESVHQRAHEGLWDTLRERGVPVDRYATVIGAIRSVEPRVPPTIRLSVTAALEHYTAAFGDAFLREHLDEAIPVEMARLLAWHGLEELEHRAVAFDVLQSVDDRYAIRLVGFAIATGMLTFVPLIGVAMNLAAELGQGDTPVAGGGRTTSIDHSSATVGRRELRSMTGRFLRRLGRHVADYLRPGFHPDDRPLPPEAATWAATLSV